MWFLSTPQLVFLFMVLPLTIDAALAQSTTCHEDREIGAKALDEVTWKRLSTIYEEVGEEKYDEAYDELQKMLGKAERDDYLQAVIYQALAQIEWSREDFDAALGFFEQAIALDALPDHAHFALMYQVAHLYFMKDRYNDALERLDLWFCTAPQEKINSEAWVLKASILVQMKNYRQTLVAIETAIGLESAPQEAWYQLKLACHYELEQYPQAAETLELMIAHWPDRKSYWTQLAQTYFNLKRDDKALAIAGLAYRKNLMDTQSDLLYLSNLYANSNVPFKSATVLQKGIEDGVVEPTEKIWTAVGEAWYASEEMDKALAAYEMAGRASKKGEIDLRRGYILVDLERWSDAREALDLALEKDGLNDHRTGEAYLLRGMIAFNQQDFDQASGDWGRASNYLETRETALQWMNHLQEERQRQQP